MISIEIHKYYLKIENMLPNNKFKDKSLPTYKMLKYSSNMLNFRYLTKNKGFPLWLRESKF